MKRPAKVQRWIDLIAALLMRYQPVPFERLAKDVPAYADPDQNDAARMRMFERDKDELRNLGVPIETITDPDYGVRYQLKSLDFYLPYIAVNDDDAEAPAAPTGGHGYGKLPVLAFEPDELVMIARAATRVQAMRHPVLAADAATALRKLAFDVTFMDEGVREVMLLPFGEQDPAVLETLDDAVRRHKFVEFDYRSMERDERARRSVAPYGLTFISGLWYLVAHDSSANALRHFRVSRISNPAVNPLREQKPDFSVPADFNLWEHAESRQAWELGDGDATEVIVRFNATDAHTAAGATLGTAVPGDDSARQFVVRRPEAFVRWLLSFGGAATPLSPKPIVNQWRRLAKETAALYRGIAVEAHA